MKILPAIQFKETLTGGSTDPWSVELLTEENGPELYVVKMFNPKQVRQQHAVAKEVFGNLLAQAFHLPVPECALARFTPDFLSTLPEKALERNKQCSQGLRFASKYHEGYMIFADVLINSKIRDYDMPSVYAFDTLVCNLDRGRNPQKPNLLINDDDYLLIDHELIFPFANDSDEGSTNIIDDFLQDDWKFRSQAHLFHPYLKNLPSSKKDGIFDGFARSLRQLDPDILVEPAQFLTENGISCGNVDLISEYLSTIKENSDKFIRILQRQII